MQCIHEKSRGKTRARNSRNWSSRYKWCRKWRRQHWCLHPQSYSIQSNHIWLQCFLKITNPSSFASTVEAQFVAAHVFFLPCFLCPCTSSSITQSAVLPCSCLFKSSNKVDEVSIQKQFAPWFTLTNCILTLKSFWELDWSWVSDCRLKSWEKYGFFIYLEIWNHTWLYHVE